MPARRGCHRRFPGCRSIDPTIGRGRRGCSRCDGSGRTTPESIVRDLLNEIGVRRDADHRASGINDGCSRRSRQSTAEGHLAPARPRRRTVRVSAARTALLGNARIPRDLGARAARITDGRNGRKPGVGRRQKGRLGHRAARDHAERHVRRFTGIRLLILSAADGTGEGVDRAGISRPAVRGGDARCIPLRNAGAARAPVGLGADRRHLGRQRLAVPFEIAGQTGAAVRVALARKRYAQPRGARVGRDIGWLAVEPLRAVGGHRARACLDLARQQRRGNERGHRENPSCLGLHCSPPAR
jgi:hypothetical protein